MVPPVASIVRRPWRGSCLKQERIIYEEQPFYSLERVPKPRENGFGTRYLVKLAVAGAVHSGTGLILEWVYLASMMS